MSKKYARFLSLLFCGALFLGFSANALTPDKTFSDVENRTLAQRPQATVRNVLSGAFMADYETYTIDQFPGRDYWVAAKAWSERLIGKQENNGVYFCDGSTLITRFDAPDQKRLESNLNYINTFAQKSTAPVTVGLIPTAAKIWADKLPQGAPNYDQALVISQAQQGLTVPVQDFTAALAPHSGEAIFYRTDHHWTSLGAYYAYAALGPTLGYEPLPLETYTRTTVSTEFYGTVFSSSGVRWVEPDEMDIYVPEEGITVVSHTYDASGNPVAEPRQLYDESYLAKKDKYSMFLGGQQALGVVTTPNTDKPKLLLIRDSYSDSLVPFLTPHFSEIHLIDLRYYKLSTSQYIADNGIDQALVLYSVPNFAESSLVWLGR
ncbi:DHHW family protein [Vermiculatibacterium agrestimuris]|uniref:DHHW family protein n=1 Tax=Vermiculatibacterium agrestimuris TaxID=2941519 RepID=UPI0020405C83|nr:DHHW family protein [Vermiculatibacterium agrestimuris]